jgi:hypothetical protein
MHAYALAQMNLCVNVAHFSSQHDFQASILIVTSKDCNDSFPPYRFKLIGRDKRHSILKIQEKRLLPCGMNGQSTDSGGKSADKCYMDSTMEDRDFQGSWMHAHQRHGRFLTDDQPAFDAG